MIFHGSLGQLEDFFSMDEIDLIKIGLCDGLQIGRLAYSLDHDATYPRLEGFA